MRAGAIRQPPEPDRMTRVVVSAGDVVAVGQPAPALRDEVSAQVRPAALEVPAEVQAPANPRLDHAIAEELHVALPLSRTHPGPEIARVLGRDTPRDEVAILGSAVAAAAAASTAPARRGRRRRSRSLSAG